MWLTLLLGCRDPEVSAFLSDRSAAICARHARCGTLEDAGFADEAACLDALDAADAELGAEGALACPAFDAAAASTCLDAWADAACDVPPDLGLCEAVCTEQ